MEIEDGRAGTFSNDLDEAWVKVNASWYNRGSYVKSDVFYVMYEAYKVDDVSTQLSLWVDLWISEQEASTSCAGRVAALYYGMTETGWGPFTEWGVKSGLGSSSTFEDILQDADGYAISASELKMFKVFVKLGKTDSSCDNHQWALLHENLQWRTLPPSSVLVGLAAPILIPTTFPDMTLGTIASALNTINIQLASLSTSLASATQTPYFVMAGIIDSAFNFFGIPFSVEDATTLIQTFGAYMGVSVTYITATIGPIFTVFADSALFILNYFTRVVNLYIQIATIVKGILDGTYTITTGLGNVWVLINLEGWQDFIPIVLLISWFLSVDERAKKGVSWTQIFWGDISTIIAVISFIFDWSMRVLNFVVDWVFKLINAIPI